MMHSRLPANPMPSSPGPCHEHALNAPCRQLKKCEMQRPLSGECKRERKRKLNHRFTPCSKCSDRAYQMSSRHGSQSGANDSSLELTGSWWGCYLHSSVPSVAEQIELQAKLLNYFLGSNKSNINQRSTRPCSGNLHDSSVALRRAPQVHCTCLGRE